MDDFPALDDVGVELELSLLEAGGVSGVRGMGTL